jgi:signal transduction histidine kinase
MTVQLSLNFRRLIIIASGLTVILLLGAFVLGILTARSMRDIVSNEFNTQQLVLANHIASHVEGMLGGVKEELLSASREGTDYHLEGAYARTRQEGVVELRLIDPQGKVLLFGAEGGTRAGPGGLAYHPDYKARLKWFREHPGLQDVLSTGLFFLPGAANRPMMSFTAPRYGGGQLTGLVEAIIDAAELTRITTASVRSGKTGYGWIIDNRGTFIYHPEQDFIGKNAFTARLAKAPYISFDQINRIQKEKMLAGQSGTSDYISGWHRGIEGQIKKLIAYAAVRLPGQPSAIWSAAVVAPVSEVEDAVHQIYMRQLLLQGLIIFALIFTGVAIGAYEFSWLRTLESVVQRKTKDCQESEERYRSLVEGASDLIYTVDRDGRFLSLNCYAQNFLQGDPLRPRQPGQTCQFIPEGMRLHDFFPPEQVERQLNLIRQVFDSGRGERARYEVEVGLKHYWLSTELSPLKDSEGRVKAVLAIARDITEHKAAEEQMYNTEKLASLGTLAAGVAHEINNPLAVILGFSELILEKAEPGSQLHHDMTVIERQAGVAKRIVENVLSFARLSERAEEVTDVTIDLKAVLGMTAHTLMTEKIKLEVDIEPNLPRVRGDSREYQQVFLNLISNARHAMEGGGTLYVTARFLPGAALGMADRVNIQFRDTGCGIKKEIIPRIFDPFFTTKKVGEGTGLGLSVSYGIITRYGGVIGVDSVTEEEHPASKGTVFGICLPVAETKEVESGRAYSHS